MLTEEDEIREGGAAMTAYARLQFEEMSEYERGDIRRALLQYCELDTLAMVMIYEAWREDLRFATSSIQSMWSPEFPWYFNRMQSQGRTRWAN